MRNKNIDNPIPIEKRHLLYLVLRMSDCSINEYYEIWTDRPKDSDIVLVSGHYALYKDLKES